MEAAGLFTNSQTSPNLETNFDAFGQKGSRGHCVKPSKPKKPKAVNNLTSSGSSGLFQLFEEKRLVTGGFLRREKFPRKMSITAATSSEKTPDLAARPRVTS